MTSMSVPPFLTNAWKVPTSATASASATNDDQGPRP
jgi:hypothetical protein